MIPPYHTNHSSCYHATYHTNYHWGLLHLTFKMPFPLVKRNKWKAIWAKRRLAYFILTEHHHWSSSIFFYFQWVHAASLNLFGELPGGVFDKGDDTSLSDLLEIFKIPYYLKFPFFGQKWPCQTTLVRKKNSSFLAFFQLRITQFWNFFLKNFYFFKNFDPNDLYW